MDVDLRAGIVRILKPDGSTAGTGFVVSDQGLIATCAHVVEAAGAGPGDKVRLVFHATGDVQEAIVEPEWWCDPKAQDVALLRLEAPFTENVQPLPIARSRGSKGHHFETFGFPPVNPEEGIWGSGTILGETTIGGARVLQLNSPEVTSGFSGAPVWDRDVERVTGMVTAITPPDKHGRLAETAFATPIDVLVELWPEALLRELVDIEKDYAQRGTVLQDREQQQYQQLMERLDRLEEQLSRLSEQRIPKPRSIDILRQATKLFCGDLAEALTGKPRKRLRQLCLTQASKLPHSQYLDMELLDHVVDYLGQLEREARILMEAQAIEPVPGLLGTLELRAQILGDCLRRIYRMEEGDAFELSTRGASRRQKGSTVS